MPIALISPFQFRTETSTRVRLHFPKDASDTFHPFFSSPRRNIDIFSFLRVPNCILSRPQSGFWVISFLWKFQPPLYGGKTLPLDMWDLSLLLSFPDFKQMYPFGNVILSPASRWSYILSARLGAYNWCPRTCVQCVEFTFKKLQTIIIWTYYSVVGLEHYYTYYI